MERAKVSENAHNALNSLGMLAVAAMFGYVTWAVTWMLFEAIGNGATFLSASLLVLLWLWCAGLTTLALVSVFEGWQKLGEPTILRRAWARLIR